MPHIDHEQQREIIDSAVRLTDRGADVSTRAMFHALTLDEGLLLRAFASLGDAFALRGALDGMWDELSVAEREVIGSAELVHGSWLHGALSSLRETRVERMAMQLDEALD